MPIYSDPTPKFCSTEFLIQHSKDIVSFYQAHAVDSKTGGFFHYFQDNGQVDQPNHRHLVSSTRMVINDARAIQYQLWDDLESLRARIEHGISFVEHQHQVNISTAFGTYPGFQWELNLDQEQQQTPRLLYGLSFVLLMYAETLRAGRKQSQQPLELVSDLIQTLYFEHKHNLYIDEYDHHYQSVSPYRGQNSNMHLCEALISCYLATNSQKYLDQACDLANQVMTQLGGQSQHGFIWEHYRPDWSIDWQYHKENPKHLFKPWGFQIGHQTEWSKLLIQLYEITQEDHLFDRANELFKASITLGWDHEYGGLIYGVNPELEFFDTDKYFWVQAETLAAAAGLSAFHTCTHEQQFYKQWYNKIWQYAWQHMVDHKYGAWYRVLNQKNQRLESLKSPAGKTDYHTLGACLQSLDWLKIKKGA